MMFSKLYDRKHLFNCLMWFGIVFGLMRVTGGAGFAIVIPMVVYAALARKPEALLFWLLVAVCSLVVNPYVVFKDGAFAWMQRGVMVFLGLVMAVNVMSYPLHTAIRPYTGVMFYIVFMMLSSMQGWNPKISFLKLTLFVLVYFSYVGVSNQVGINPKVSSRRIRSVMLSMAVLFIVGSIALVPFPNLSQLRMQDIDFSTIDMSNFKSLFMGMTSHSQCLGPVVSITAVILLGDLIFSIKKADALYIFLLCCCPYLVYRTSSRTGMGAYLLGQLFVIWVFMNARGMGSKWKSKVMTVAMTILMLLVIALAFSQSVHERAVKYIMKSTSAQEVRAEEAMSTRMGLVVNALYNFRKSPLLGNGFQVSEAMKKSRGGNLAILSAPIEKGVWVTAILEEGGVIGWLIFVIFLVVCIVKSIKCRAYIGASCLFVFTMTNLGEFSFFSMSYLGGFGWAMVFMGLAIDIRKMRDENEELRRRMEFEQMQMAMSA